TKLPNLTPTSPNTKRGPLVLSKLDTILQPNLRFKNNAQYTTTTTYQKFSKILNHPSFGTSALKIRLQHLQNFATTNRSILTHKPIFSSPEIKQLPYK
ncbi:8621_t:CDS:1, partial [Ambispora leptoticha]